MKVKLSFSKMGIFIFIILGSFLSPLQEVLPEKIILFTYFISILLIAIDTFKCKKIYLDKQMMMQKVLWIVFLLCYLFNNADLSRRYMGTYVRGLVCFIFLVIIGTNIDWCYFAFRCVYITSMIHALATIFFFFFPEYWKHYSYAVFGNYVAGTANGTRGYTAALNGHYSTNGTIVAFAALCGLTIIIASKNRKERIKNLFFAIISIIAVLLTSKRAHILFVFLSFLIVYFILNFDRHVLKTCFKISLLCLCSFAIVKFFLQYIPVLNEVFRRFQTVGQDAQTITRFSMWNLAYKIFTEHKIFGIGWGAYKFEFAKLNMYEGIANAHNIYLQLLAETGIVGFLLFIFIAFSSIISLLKVIKKVNITNSNEQERKIVTFALMFQIFVLLYGFTGNPLYDFVLIFYTVSLAVGYGISYKIRGGY